MAKRANSGQDSDALRKPVRWLVRHSLFTIALLGSTQAPALAAPAPDLVGKSLALSWTEDRQQKVPTGELRNVAVSFNLSIYVSGAGRPFTRLTSVGGGGASSNDQVGAQGGSLGGGVRTVTVNGRTISLQANYGNYARALQIEVAQGGGSCSAQMTIGKRPGSAPTAFRTTSGISVEIHSVSASSVTCSIQQGNVFGR